MSVRDCLSYVNWCVKGCPLRAAPFPGPWGHDLNKNQEMSSSMHSLSVFVIWLGVQCDSCSELLKFGLPWHHRPEAVMQHQPFILKLLWLECCLASQEKKLWWALIMDECLCFSVWKSARVVISAWSICNSDFHTRAVQPQLWTTYLIFLNIFFPLTWEIKSSWFVRRRCYGEEEVRVTGKV